MSQTSSSASYFLTPYIVAISSDNLSQTQINHYLTSQTGLPVSQETISLINENKLTITIDMIRSLLSDMSYASFQGKVRHICLLYVDQTTIEAQNAVLKLLEEPPKNTQFWLFTQFPQLLLPTIISRCMEITWEQDLSKTADQESMDAAALQLLDALPTASHRELIERAEKYPERLTAQAFINSVLVAIHQKNANNPNSKHTAAMNVLLETKQYLSANVSPKLALEHCFFVLKKLFS